MLYQRLRPQTGQSMIALGMVIAVFILLAAGLFGFEVNRVELGREQLAAACDAAALAGAATLASSDNLDPATAQTEAMNTALTTFQQNTVLGTQLSNAYLAGGGGDTPAADGSSL